MNNAKKSWRDIFFSGVIAVLLIAIIIIFGKEPTVQTFKDTSFILAVGFTLLFFICGGHSLPDEKKWKTFSRTVTVCLAVSFLVQLFLSIICFKATHELLSMPFFFFIISLIGAYLLAFWIFIIRICDYETSKDNKT